MQHAAHAPDKCPRLLCGQVSTLHCTALKMPGTAGKCIPNGHPSPQPLPKAFPKGHFITLKRPGLRMAKRSTLARQSVFYLCWQCSSTSCLLSGSQDTAVPSNTGVASAEGMCT